MVVVRGRDEYGASRMSHASRVRDHRPPPHNSATHDEQPRHAFTHLFPRTKAVKGKRATRLWISYFVLTRAMASSDWEIQTRVRLRAARPQVRAICH